MISVEDIGGIVARIFNEPEAFTGRTVGAVGADWSCEEYAAATPPIPGVPVQYKYVSRDLYASFGFPGAAEVFDICFCRLFRL